MNSSIAERNDTVVALVQEWIGSQNATIVELVQEWIGSGMDWFAGRDNSRIGSDHSDLLHESCVLRTP